MIGGMARFSVGDCVRRESSSAADYVSVGRITAVIPNHHHLEIFTEYEVDFAGNGILIAYESQLKPFTLGAGFAGRS
jgi:hypothetical protein